MIAVIYLVSFDKVVSSAAWFSVLEINGTQLV